MAIVFELQVYFGKDLQARDLFRAQAEAAFAPLSLEGHAVAFHPPHSTFHNADYTNTTIMPHGVSFGIPDDEPLNLGDAAMELLEDYMYSILRTLSGYHSALVGWEVSDIEDHIQEAIKEGVFPPGLVMREDLAITHPNAQWQAFSPGYVWLDKNVIPAGEAI